MKPATPELLRALERLETRYQKEKSVKFDQKEEKMVMDLLRSALKHEPIKRPSTLFSWS